MFKIIIVLFVGGSLATLINILVSKIINYINKKKVKRNSLNYIVLTIIILVVLYISYMNFSSKHNLIIAVVFDSIIIIGSYVDYKYKVIPNKFVLISFVIGVISLILTRKLMIDNIYGMVIGGMILLIIAIMPGGLMGGGDVKYMVLIGLFLGIEKTIFAICISFVLGSVIALILIIFRFKKLKDTIAFGPILSIGSFIAYTYYDSVIDKIIF
ncbi:hypothetical protein SH1V18_48060 [Vallitalea longa]|uniref:Prepilin type IV endopeptidase peptidase domain-containing protein n=1 Tax=Vallitalea longa TaxID=2936439 RepID=A0A9W6DGI2_9FIRM|nr:A24 family peptidase [Vallitalea longa]GKX32326.1 hypothetical protein SH1V18_48060 [Vallitalea longa]